MVERSGTPLPSEAVGGLLLDAMEVRLRESMLVWRPGAQALLLECRRKGIPTALVSASWARLISAVGQRIDDELGLPAFDLIVAGDDVENSKPHPEPYLTAAAGLGQEPGACLALEDSPTGVRSAIAAGCVVVAIPHIAAVDEPTALVVDTLSGRDLSGLWREACGPAACR
jgi:HAD superfamily hydrolase (TIGR01509 family)